MPIPDIQVHGSQYVVDNKWFTSTVIQIGASVEYFDVNDKYTENVGETRLRPYEGGRFAGVSLNQVVRNLSLRYTHNPFLTNVGSKVAVASQGTFRLPRNLFKNGDCAKVGSFFRPAKNGKWKIQTKKTKRTVGIVSDTRNSACLLVRIG